MKEALQAHRPLSDKNPALGVEKRTAALMPFVNCVRRHLMVVTGLAIDAKAFKSLPNHYFQLMGDDPSFTAFTRTLLAVLEITHPEDKISLICDDEEEMALPMYRLFRRVKKIYPDAHEKLRAITFADDRWSFGLQAADMVVSLTRQEAGNRFFGAPYDYSPLFAALSSTVPRNGETFWMISLGFCDAGMLKRLAANWAELKPHNLEEVKATFEAAKKKL